MQAPDTQVYEDNTACIDWGNHVIGKRERSKHNPQALSTRKELEVTVKLKMRLIKVDTSGQLADIFTKPLQLQQFLACREGILNGQSGQALFPKGPGNSKGGEKLPSMQARGSMLGHWTPRDELAL